MGGRILPHPPLTRSRAGGPMGLSKPRGKTSMSNQTRTKSPWVCRCVVSARTTGGLVPPDNAGRPTDYCLHPSCPAGPGVSVGGCHVRTFCVSNGVCWCQHVVCGGDVSLHLATASTLAAQTGHVPRARSGRGREAGPVVLPDRKSALPHDQPDDVGTPHGLGPAGRRLRVAGVACSLARPRQVRYAGGHGTRRHGGGGGR